MAKLKPKGVVIQVRISGVYTAVAQAVSLDLDESKNVTYDANTLDAGTAVPKENTGQSEYGDASGEIFVDHALSGHRFLMALVTTPADTDWKFIMTDAGAREINGTGCGFGLGMAVAMGDGIKSSFSITWKTGYTYPTS